MTNVHIRCTPARSLYLHANDDCYSMKVADSIVKMTTTSHIGLEAEKAATSCCVHANQPMSVSAHSGGRSSKLVSRGSDIASHLYSLL